MLWHHHTCIDGKLSLDQVQEIFRISGSSISRRVLCTCFVAALKAFSSSDPDTDDEQGEEEHGGRCIRGDDLIADTADPIAADTVDSALLASRINISEFILLVHLVCTQVPVPAIGGDSLAKFGQDCACDAPLGPKVNSPSPAAAALLNVISSMAEYHSRKMITDICRSLVEVTSHRRDSYKIPASDIMFLCHLGGLVRYCFPDGNIVGGDRSEEKLSMDKLARLIDVLNWNFKATDLTYSADVGVSAIDANKNISSNAHPLLSTAKSAPVSVRNVNLAVVAEHLIERFLLNMCQIVETMCGASYASIVQPYVSIGNEQRSIVSRCSLFLAKTVPALLLGFNIYTLRAPSVCNASIPTASEYTVPVPTGPNLHVHDLYGKEGIRCITSDYVPLLQLLYCQEQKSSAKAVSVGDSSVSSVMAYQSAVVTLSRLLHLCETKCIIPVLLDKEVWVRVCCSYFGLSAVTYPSALDISVHLDCVMELIFMLAQLIFSTSATVDLNNNAGPIGVVSEGVLAKRRLLVSSQQDQDTCPVGKFRKLLGFFVDSSKLTGHMTEAAFMSSNAPMELAASALLHHHDSSSSSGAFSQSASEPSNTSSNISPIPIIGDDSHDRGHILVSPMSDSTVGSITLATGNPDTDAMPQISPQVVVTRDNLKQELSAFHDQLSPHLKPMGSTRQEIMMILLHFPINNFGFNPWVLYDLILVKDIDDVDVDLSEVLREVCNVFDVTYERLLDYISSLFELQEREGERSHVSKGEEEVGEKVVIKAEVARNLATDCLRILTTPTILKLLSVNEDLMHWEYLQCCSYHRSNAFPTVPAPLPFGFKLQYADCSFADTVITRSAAVAWAEQVTSSSNWNITNDIASGLFDECCEIPMCSRSFPGMKTKHSEKYLSFSLFVMFSVKLFTRYITISMADIPRDEKMTLVLQKAFVDACGAMLHVFSERLSKTQQVVKARLLPHLLSVPNIEFEWRDQLNNIVQGKREQELLDVMVSLYSYAMDTYAQFCQLHITRPVIDRSDDSWAAKRKSILPPFPYNKFWDVCRFVNYCKFIGLYTKPSAVTLLSLSLIDLWQIYGIFQMVLKKLLEQQRAGNEQIPISRFAINQLITDSIRSLMGYDNTQGCYDSAPPRDIVVSPKPIRIDTNNGILNDPAAVPTSTSASAGSGTSGASTSTMPMSSASAAWFSILMQCVSHFIIERLRDHELRHGVGVLVNDLGEESWVGEREDHLDANTARKTVELKHEVKLCVLTQVVAHVNRTIELHGSDKRTNVGDFSAESTELSLRNLARCGFQLRPGCCELEELLRYGGQSVVNTLQYFRAFTDCVYAYLVKTSGNKRIGTSVEGQFGEQESSTLLLDEPLFSTICEFLSVGYLLWSDSDADGACITTALIKTFHRRNRPALHKRRTVVCGGSDGNSRVEVFVDSNVVTVSFQEFEEMLLVCALELHLRAGSKNSAKPESTTAGSDRVGRASPWKVCRTSASQALLEDYCKHANGRAMTRFKLPTHVAQNGSGDSTQAAPFSFAWGVDFLWPYLCILKGHFIRLYRKAPFDLSTSINSSLGSSMESPVFTPISEEFYKQFMTVEHNPSSLPTVLTGLTNEVMTVTAVGTPQQSVGKTTSSSARELGREKVSPRSSHNSSVSSPRSPSIAETSVSSVAQSATSNTGSISVKSVERRRQLQQKASQMNSTRRGNTNKLVAAIDNIVDGTKEALWPLFVTYCSCGDSFDPGKLSGPNVFSLLSKLSLLNQYTQFSDIGLLMHQISAHTISEVPFKLDVILANASAAETLRGSPSTISSGSEMGLGQEAKGYAQNLALESPALTFEEFLVFLCAYSQLYYDGKIDVPTAAPPLKSLDIMEQREHQEWFEKWQIVMHASSTFKRLINEKVFPPLLKDKNSPISLLACPSEARIRDKYVSLFTLDVVLAIEGAEDEIRRLVAKTGTGTLVHSPLILTALQSLDLVPGVIEEPTIIFTLSDVLPGAHSVTKELDTQSVLALPQWEWVLCVVAFHSVEYAINKNPLAITKFNPKKIPALVADVVKTVATRMIELASTAAQKR